MMAGGSVTDQQSSAAYSSNPILKSTGIENDCQGASSDGNQKKRRAPEDALSMGESSSSAPQARNYAVTAEASDGHQNDMGQYETVYEDDVIVINCRRPSNASRNTVQGDSGTLQASQVAENGDGAGVEKALEMHQPSNGAGQGENLHRNIRSRRSENEDALAIAPASMTWSSWNSNGRSANPQSSSSFLAVDGRVHADGRPSPVFRTRAAPIWNLFVETPGRRRENVNRFGVRRNAYNSYPSDVSPSPVVRQMEAEIRGGGSIGIPYIQTPLEPGFRARVESPTTQFPQPTTVRNLTGAQLMRSRVLTEDIEPGGRFSQLYGLFDDEDEPDEEDEEVEYDDDDDLDEMLVDLDSRTHERLLDLQDENRHVRYGATDDSIREHLRQRTFQPIEGCHPAEIENCCICLEDYEGGDIVGKLDCGHEYHATCISLWLRRRNRCPLCKDIGLTDY